MTSSGATSSGIDRDVVTGGVHAGLQGLGATLLKVEGDTIVERLLVLETIQPLLFGERPNGHGAPNDEHHRECAIETDGK